LAGQPTWRQLWSQARGLVGEEARRLVESASGRFGADWVLCLDRPAAPAAKEALGSMLARRRAGEPLQYVVGSWGFRGLDLHLDPRVMIPRPETEQVAEVALAELRRLARGAPGRRLRAADLGTGSGAIALSLVAELPAVEVWATDASAAALDVARANLAGLGGPGARVTLAQGRWYRALPPELAGHLDLVVSNPPYVPEADWAALAPEVRAWEPKSALVPGPAGTEALAEIVGQAPAWLARPGSLVVEVGEGQASVVSAWARQAGFGSVEVVADLAGRPRALLARAGH
jgi:release factor glutamine methyltransferase